MFNYFERLRKLPEPERRRKAFSIALFVTLAIAVVWGGALAWRISGTDFSFKDEFPGKGAVPSFSETLSNFGDRVGEIFNRKGE